MDILEIRDYLLSLPSCEECQPFGDDIVVYKVCGKMFACTAFDRPGIIAMKCNPDRAILLRDTYPSITPAWHFNKKHWNDVNTDMLDVETVCREINHSYLTVIKKNVSPRSLKESLLRSAAEAGIEDTECPE